MSRGIGGKFELGYANWSGGPESETQSLGNPNRPRDLGDFDCGSFLTVSQITETVRNGRLIWAVGLSRWK